MEAETPELSDIGCIVSGDLRDVRFVGTAFETLSVPLTLPQMSLGYMWSAGKT